MKKTLFLVSLATAKRGSELQALSRRVSYQGEDIILYSLPEFVAKTECVSNILPREFKLQSLSAVVGSEDEERLLCPVGAVKYVLERTGFSKQDQEAVCLTFKFFQTSL